MIVSKDALIRTIETTVDNKLNVKDFDVKEFLLTKKILINTVSKAINNDDILKAISKINEYSTILFEHSIFVAMISMLVANKMDWTLEKNQLLLVLGSLLHDIGKTTMPEKLYSKKISQFNFKERKEYELHPKKGAEILNSIENIPPEVVIIAEQHHEQCNGKGFPNKLLKAQIHPLVKIVSVVNDFTNNILNFSNDEKTGFSFKEALFLLLKVNKLNYDFETLEKFIKIFIYNKEIKEILI